MEGLSLARDRPPEEALVRAERRIMRAKLTDDRLRSDGLSSTGVGVDEVAGSGVLGGVLCVGGQNRQRGDPAVVGDTC